MDSNFARSFKVIKVHSCRFFTLGFSEPDNLVLHLIFRLLVLALYEIRVSLLFYAKACFVVAPGRTRVNASDSVELHTLFSKYTLTNVLFNRY